MSGDSFLRDPQDFSLVLGGPVFQPVQVPTKYELVINLKTAKALGIEVPLSLQQRAFGPKRTSERQQLMSAIGGKADIPPHDRHVRF